MYAREHYYIEIINRVRISSPRSLPFSLPEKCGILLKVTVDQLTFWLFLPHLPADAPQTASRRNRDYVPTQLALRGDVAPAASPRSGVSVCRVLQRASPQGRCTTFGTTIAFCRFFLYLCTVLEERLHCHSLRTANGKLTTKKRRGKRQGCTPALSLSDCWTTKKRKEKENEKGSLENYLAGDYRRTYCRRHYARRYQLHVNWFV